MGIKKILLNLLGEKNYLSFLSTTFQRLYRLGLLGKEYQDIYFLKKIIEKGDYCLDIGAHLGYYTLELSRLTGSQGKVFAIEPMSPFHNTLKALLQKQRVTNVSLLQIALGGNGEYVEMGIPRVGDRKKFAHARIKESSPELEFVESEKVKNESGDHLFSNLGRLDYIKCDVEGSEYAVFFSLTKTLAAYQPILLCEVIDRDLRLKLFGLLSPFGYKAYTLEGGRLLPLDVYGEETIVSQNNYFIPPQREERIRPLIQA